MSVETRVRPSNLPAQFTSFVGRTRDLHQALDVLASTRLLALLGPGGSGKTRLALQLAGLLGDRFPDGSWWVDLASLTEDEQVAGAMADALGVRPLPGRTPTQAATEHLGDDEVLVVLDNCEHVVSGAADLSEAVLRGCPRAVVLATSRIPLGVPGESSWRVPPLALPASDLSDEIAQSDACLLFVERAIRAAPEFALRDENAAAVSRICRELDGLPLAIELAAARVRLLSLNEIAEGLVDRFRMLSGGGRGADPRQQTLRASMDWSYALLSEGDRVLLRRLAVFPGGWTLDAVESVCSLESVKSDSVLDQLASLVDQSLVMVEPHDLANRFRLHETVRDYGAELLAASGELEALRARHRDFYADLAA
ncbi:MAG: ATP-binding protein, partial [Acidimicrobiales bacterium]